MSEGNVTSFQARVILRHGQVREIAKRAGVGTRAVARVAGAKVRVWSGEAELVRRVLIEMGLCPTIYLPEDPARRVRTWDD